MKRICAAYVLIFCMLLSGCGTGRQAKNRWESFSEGLNASSGISCTVDMRAEYEDKTAKFTLAYEETGAEGTVTVLSPSLIQGISAHIHRGSTSLEYEDVVLETGDLDAFGLSPMSAVPMMISAMKSGYYEAYALSGDIISYELVPDDNSICTVWFGSGMTPLRAEIASEGRVRVYMEFRDWEIRQ